MDEQWRAVLGAAREEPLRNRVMLALKYDAALRREELCSLETGDIDPTRRLLRVRAETTKNRQERHGRADPPRQGVRRRRLLRAQPARGRSARRPGRREE